MALGDYKTGSYYTDLVSKSQSPDEKVKGDALAELDRIDKEQYQAQYGPKSFDIGEFENLLGRLEASKTRQQRQKSVEGRRDIYAQGLASMMSNF